MVFWAALVLAGVAMLILLGAFTVLLGTTSHRKVALPLVWTGVSLLAVASTTLVLLLVHR